MAISDKLDYLLDTKQAIKQAIIDKGQAVADTDNFRSYAEKIEAIETGGGDSIPIGMIDGTLETFNAGGAEIVAPYRCYQFKNLKSVDLTGVKEVGNNAFKDCNKITALTLPASITNIGNYAFQNVNNANLAFVFEPSAMCDVGQYAFQNTKLTSIKGEIGDIGSYAFAGNSTALTEIDIKVNGEIGAYAFSNAYKVSSFKIDGKVGGELGNYAFSAVGAQRQTPENNIFDLDFSTSSFTTLGQTAFGSGYSSNKNQYYKIRFPKLLSIISDYAFQYSDNMDLYFTREIPATLNSNAFSNATNYKIFVPYTAINAYKNATNWAAQVANMVGFADVGTFAQGQKLPMYNIEGYALTWYSDKALTQVVTEAADPDSEYYCTAGTEKVAVGITMLYANGVDLVVSDGTNQYYQDYGVPIGTTLTITATPKVSGYIPYQFTLNGETIASGDTYTAVADTDITIIAIYWDGVNLPANPNFADNEWLIIKAVAQAGKASEVGWAVGDTKPITIEGTTYNVRISDMTAGRYQYSNENRTTNMVFELVEILPTERRMNARATNVGGWAESELRKNLNGLEGGTVNILSTLPADLQGVLEDVQIKSADGGAVAYTITESPNKLFLLSYAEVFNTATSQYLLEGSRYDYYIQNDTNADRVKKRNNLAAWWWLRSPYPSTTSRFNYVANGGAGGSNNAPNNLGVSFGFAF